MLCHLFMETLFCLPNVQIWAVRAALNSINYITLFMPECFVLGMDKFLPQCVGRFKVNRDIMFRENMYNIYNKNNVKHLVSKVLLHLFQAHSVQLPNVQKGELKKFQLQVTNQ